MTGHHHEGLKRQEERTGAELLFEAHEHEGAAAISCTVQPRKGCVIPFADLVEALMSAGATLEGAGAFIGHLTAFADDGERTAAVSITDLATGPAIIGDASVLITPGTQAQAVAIVVGLPLATTLNLFIAAFAP